MTAGGTGSWQGSATTDSSGHYVKSGLPASGTVMLQLGSPCITQMAYTNNTVVDGLLYSSAYIAQGGQPLPGSSPIISGTVYQLVNGQPQPAPNAGIIIDLASGFGLMGGWTTADSQGHYWVCKVPAGGSAVLQASYNSLSAEVPVNTTVDMTLDITVQ